MFHRFFLLLCVCGSSLAAGAAEDAAPATAPSSETQTLSQDAITYAAPAGWKFLGKRPDDRAAGYRAPDDSGEIVLTNTPQTQTVLDELGPKLASVIRRTIAAEAAKGNIQIVLPPTVEQDKRFLLRIHDRYKSQGIDVDRLELFRGVGRNLTSVTIKAYTQDEPTAKQVFETGEQVMLSVELHRAGTARSGAVTSTSADGGRASNKPLATTRPVAFEEAGLRVAPPAGWRAQSTGDSSGLIVSWRDTQDSGNLIALALRRVPSQARDDPKLRELALEQMVLAEKPVLQIEGSRQIGPPRMVADKRFLRKTRLDYEIKGVKFGVTLRQVRAGDGIVAITAMAEEDRADEIDALADQVAISVRSLAR